MKMKIIDGHQARADNHREIAVMNKKSRTIASFLEGLLTLFAALLLPALAHAQNCALCYTQAAGSGQRFIAALRSGILVLMIPPMAITIGIAVMAYRKRNQFNED